MIKKKRTKGVGKNYSVNPKIGNTINTVDVDYYSGGGSNHLKISEYLLFRSNFHYSLPYHTQEVRITALVQILHQQLGARRRAGFEPPERPFLSILFQVFFFQDSCRHP